MDKQALIEKLKKIEASPSCCPELREAIKKYFDALGSPREKIAAEELIDEIKADVVLVEHMAVFARSNTAIEMLGAEVAKKFAAHADELRRRGVKYCNCLACTLGLEILDNKEILLA